MLCPLGMSLVVIYQQSPTFLIDVPQGRRGWGLSPGALTMLADEVTWERLDVHTELFVYVGASQRRYELLSTQGPFGVPI